MEIRIVDTLLERISEYVDIDIRDEHTDISLTYYDSSINTPIDETYLNCKIENFVVDNGLVTIWVYTR